jgi:hypothetical protein
MDKPKNNTVLNSYLRSKLAESVKLLTGIQDLFDSVLDKDNDCPDRLPVIIVTISRQIPAYYSKCDHYCFFSRASQLSIDPFYHAILCNPQQLVASLNKALNETQKSFLNILVPKCMTKS